MTDDRALELTHILVEYARQVANSSFSQRVAAMTEAREQILALFSENAAAEVVR